MSMRKTLNKYLNECDTWIPKTESMEQITEVYRSELELELMVVELMDNLEMLKQDTKTNDKQLQKQIKKIIDETKKLHKMMGL